MNRCANLLICLVLLWAPPVALGADAGALSGVVVEGDSTPVPHAVIYDLRRARLSVLNNAVLKAEHIPRVLSDADGRFTLDRSADGEPVLFVRDIQDRLAFATLAPAGEPVRIVLQLPAAAKGILLNGDSPVAGKEIVASFRSPSRSFEYSHKTRTDDKGRFRFEALLPGPYRFVVEEEVPQVGCSFRSAVTKQATAELAPGREATIKLGGTDLPYLRGRVTSADGAPLHGVWVRLIAKSLASTKADSGEPPPRPVLAAVTNRSGQYGIYDIPPGEYELHCFRRLALNGASRVLRDAKPVTIKGAGESATQPTRRVENVFDVSVDMAPFMPLEYDAQAPPISATCLNGGNFRLADHRGKVVVLHFYATWCAPCVATFDDFEKLHRSFDEGKVTVVGISLDEDVARCRSFLAKKDVRHGQVFDGPWNDRKIARDYRVADLPTTIIIAPDGSIAQMDLFGATLRNFVEELLAKGAPGPGGV